MPQVHAKLRPDLEFYPESAAKSAAVVVKDPISRAFYRFPQVQASALEAFNGETDFASIAAVVSKIHGVEVTEDQIKEFAGKLRKLSLLDDPECWSRLDGVLSRRRTFLKDILSIKIHTFNPDGLVSRLEKKFRFCFSMSFTALIGIVVFIATAVSMSNWESLFFSFGKLISIYSIGPVMLVGFAVMTLHEFGHAVTLKHYGRKVEEMGFLFLYFIPAFYCNVSDAWMLGRKERIRVTLAGAYVQLFIWALATMSWRLLSEETFLSRICLIIVAFSGVQTIFNLNPLIRLDGYYLLGDFLGIPNLRPRAFSYLRKRFVSWLVGHPMEIEKIGDRRSRRIYWIYGIASLTFTAIFLGLVITEAAIWMSTTYHTLGVVLFSLVIVTVVPAAVGKESAVEGTKVIRAVSSRLRKSRLFLVALALAILGGFLPWELKISGDFTILPMNKASVSTQVPGTLKSILVDQGSRIKKGAILARMENLDLSNSLEDAKGELETQRASLALLRAGARPEEIERAAKYIETKKAELSSSQRIEEQRKVILDRVARKEAEFRNARLIYERTQKLLVDGLIAKSESDRDLTAYEVLQRELAEAKGDLQVLEEETDRTREIKAMELAQAESELKVLTAGSRKEAIAAIEAQVNKLQEKIGILSHQMDYLQIRSPIDGIISSAHLQDHIGEYLSQGAAFCQIVSEGLVIAEMPIPEKEIADVKLGHPITLKVRGYPNRSFEARVKSIAPVAATSSSIRTVTVEGGLENPDGVLKTGMTGVAKVLCGKRTIFHLLTRRAVRWLRTEFWEYLP